VFGNSIERPIGASEFLLEKITSRRALVAGFLPFWIGGIVKAVLQRQQCCCSVTRWRVDGVQRGHDSIMWGPTFPNSRKRRQALKSSDRSSVNAYDDPRVARAIEATKRQKLIFAGISLEMTQKGNPIFKNCARAWARRMVIVDAIPGLANKPEIRMK